MPTRNVNLTDHQNRFIEEVLASGAYQNASEVVREGLRLVEQRRQEDAGKLARLCAAIDEAEADIAAGNVETLDMENLDVWIKSLRNDPVS